MKKIIFAITSLVIVTSFSANALATDSDATSTATSTATTASSANTNLICAANASEARDAAIISAYSSMTASTTNALTARKTALKNAWLITDKIARKNAVKNTWNIYKTELAKTRRAFKNSKRTAWKNYYTARKACKGVEADINNENVDSDM